MNAATLAFARSNARPRRFVFDSVLLLTVAAILLLGLVMMTSASISIADRQVHEPLYYLERQLIGVGLGLLAAIVAMIDSHERVGAARDAAAAARVPVADRRADSRHRARSERQPSLAARWRPELPGFRAGARAAAHVSRELCRASAGRAEGRAQGLPQAARRADGRRGAAAARAGFRRGDGADRDRPGRAVPRRGEAAPLPCAGRARGRRHGDRSP